MAGNRNIIQILINADNNSSPALDQTVRSLNRVAFAATAAFGLAANEARRFEKGLAEISTLIKGDSTAAIRLMDKELKKLSQSSGQTLQSLTKARYDIISAGFTDAAEGARILEASTKLATAGLVDAASAGDILTTALNGMGIASDDVSRVSDVLFGTVRLGKTTMTELSASLGPVFANARLAGVSLEEVGAAMATITAAGIDTREASTALGNLLRTLAAPSKEAARELKILGISLDDGLGPALAALGKQSEGGLEALAKLVPNIRALKAAASAGANIENFNSALAELSSNTGETDIAVAKMTQTFDFMARQLRQSMQVLAVEVGTSVLPALKNVTMVLTGTVRLFNALPAPIHAVGVALGATAVGGLFFVNALLLISRQVAALKALGIPALFTSTVAFNANAGAVMVLTGRFAALTTVILPFLTAYAPIAAVLGLATIAAIASAKSLSKQTGAMKDLREEADRIQSQKFAITADVPTVEQMFPGMFGGGRKMNITAPKVEEVMKRAAEETEEATQKTDMLTRAYAQVDSQLANINTRFDEMTGDKTSELEVLVRTLQDMEGAELLAARAMKAWREETELLQKQVDKSERDISASIGVLSLDIEGAAENARQWKEEMQNVADALPDVENLDIQLPTDGPIELQENWRVALHEMLTNTQGFVNAASQLINGIADSAGMAFASMILENKKWRDAFQTFGRDIIAMAVQIIARLLVIRALQALVSLIPGVGVPAAAFIGAHAAHGASGITHQRGRRKALFASSGISMIPGLSGQDSTLIAAQRGESILTEATTRRLRRDLQRPGTSLRSGLTSRRGENGKRFEISFPITRPLDAFESISLINSINSAAEDATLRGS